MSGKGGKEKERARVYSEVSAGKRECLVMRRVRWAIMKIQKRRGIATGSSDGYSDGARGGQPLTYGLGRGEEVGEVVVSDDDIGHGERDSSAYDVYLSATGE
jgi:hypothetical protein